MVLLGPRTSLYRSFAVRTFLLKLWKLYTTVIGLVPFPETRETKKLLSKLFYSTVTVSRISTRVLSRRAAKKGTMKVMSV